MFRQRDPEFVALLNAVRWGEVTEQVQSSLKECVGRKFDCTDGILPTRLFTHRKDVDHLNTKELTDLPGIRSIHPINTPYQYNLATHSLNTSTQHTHTTHPLNTPDQYTLAIHLLNTPSQHIHTTYSSSIQG